MTTYPLDEPHLEALREACTNTPEVREVAMVVVRVLEERGVLMIPWFKAHHTLSRSDLSASLVRDLLARAGVDATSFMTRVEWRVDTVVHYLDMTQGPMFDTTSDQAIRLISALCDLAPGDKEGAMRALREVGR